MPRRTHYSPCIDRVIVCALYHEGRRLRLSTRQQVNDLRLIGIFDLVQQR